MKFNIKLLPKIYRDILIAVTACLIFLFCFWSVYDIKLKKDLKEIETHIAEAKFKYACIGSHYDQQMSKQKRKNSTLNIFILKQFKPILSDGLFVYFSDWATFGRAEKRYIASRRMSKDILATEPPFCIKLTKK